MPVFVKKLPRQDRLRLWALIRESCLHGQCYSFAIVLHRALGWPMMGIIAGKDIPHVVVRQPDGTYRDSRGVITEEQIGEPFGIRPPFTLAQVSEEELRSRQPSIHEIYLSSLETKMRAIWPRLPWPPSSRERALEFLGELEALSRRYGFWIRSSTPGAPPFVSEARGEEVGYSAQLDILGSEYYFDRAFHLPEASGESEDELTEDDEMAAIMGEDD